MQSTRVHLDNADPTAVDSMHAIVQDRFGTAEVLQLETIPRPTIDDDQVLIEVHAAGVDRGTEHLMTGLPYLIRSGGIRRSPNRRTQSPASMSQASLSTSGPRSPASPRATRSSVSLTARSLSMQPLERQAGPQADQPQLRAGRSCSRLRYHRAAGVDRCWERATRSAGAGPRCLRWRRHLCGSVGQGTRSRSNRGGQHGEA